MAGRDGRMPTLFSLWRASARQENSAASSLPETTRLRFALLGAQRLKVQTERDRRRVQAAGLREEAATRNQERTAPASRSHGENALAEIRRQLKLPPSGRKSY